MPKSLHRAIPGDRLMLCDICGYEYHVSDLKKGKAEGQRGLNVCEKDYDPIHPRENTPKLSPPKKVREPN